jgi:hypothetical protein
VTRARALSRLEKLAQALARRVEAAPTQAQQHHHALLLALVSSFPPVLRRRCADALVAHGKAPWGHPALFGLTCSLSQGIWQPAPLPQELARVYLDDPLAAPGRRCTGCQLPLPERWGLFLERATGKKIYGPLHYFRACPGCGGTAIASAVPWGDDPAWASLPPVPDGVYDFRGQT